MLLQASFGRAQLTNEFASGFLDMEAEIEIECCIIQLTGWRGAWLGVSRFATPLLYNWVLSHKPHTGRCNW